MPREPRNVGASVRARLLDRARAERSDFQILLTRYAIERLLRAYPVITHTHYIWGAATLPSKVRRRSVR